MVSKESEEKVVTCPRGHQNPEGSVRCNTCGLPIVDYEMELDNFLTTLAEQERHVTFVKEKVFMGVGDQGCRLVHDFYRSWGIGLASSEFLLIDSSGDAQQLADRNPGVPSDGKCTSPSLSLHQLPHSVSKQVGYYGLGERLATSDAALDDRLLRSGVRASARNQTVFLISALGGGTGSGASPHVLECAKTRNPYSRSLVIAVMPGANEPDSAHFNAFCSLSRFIKSEDEPVADIIVLADYDRLMRVRGVSSAGEEIAAESLLSHMLALLVGAMSDSSSAEADASYLAKMSRSMGVHAFVPCMAAGRSLEIFGGLANILESALLCPLAQVDKHSIMLSFVLVQVPERLASSLKEETITSEVNKWSRDRFPNLKGSVLQVSHSSARSDRIDVCILLGGVKLAVTAKRARDGFDRFKAIVGRESWEQEFAVTSKSVAEMESAVAWYDSKLDEIASHSAKR